MVVTMLSEVTFNISEDKIYKKFLNGCVQHLYTWGWNGWRL